MSLTVKIKDLFSFSTLNDTISKNLLESELKINASRHNVKLKGNL